jgi:DNA-binding XRE family transcriptional regulator
VIDFSGDPQPVKISLRIRCLIGYYRADMMANGPTPPAVRRALRATADSLGAWRRLRGLTQAQLADRAGVSESTLYRLERGDGGVSVENLLRVLRALGLLELVPRAVDPYESDVGRLRSDERLPRRVRPRSLGSSHG